MLESSQEEVWVDRPQSLFYFVPQESHSQAGLAWAWGDCSRDLQYSCNCDLQDFTSVRTFSSQALHGSGVDPVTYL